MNPTENPHKVTRFFRIHEIVKRIWGSFAVLIDTARKSVTPVDEEEAVVPGAGIGEFFPYVSVALETAPISAQ